MSTPIINFKLNTYHFITLQSLTCSVYLCMDLKTYFKHEKDKKGITQGQFASRLDISEAYLSQLVNGKKLASYPLSCEIFTQSGGEVTYASMIDYYENVRR